MIVLPEYTLKHLFANMGQIFHFILMNLMQQRYIFIKKELYGYI